MPMVAGNKSSKWHACERKATRLEYCLRDNNWRPIDCVPEILDLKECCQVHEWKSVHCGYVPEEEPALPPSSKLVIEPQVDPIKAEQMFVEYVDQLLKRHQAHAPTKEEQKLAAEAAAEAAAHAHVGRSGSSGPSLP